MRDRTLWVNFSAFFLSKGLSWDIIIQITDRLPWEIKICLTSAFLRLYYLKRKEHISFSPWFAFRRTQAKIHTTNKIENLTKHTNEISQSSPTLAQSPANTEMSKFLVLHCSQKGVKRCYWLNQIFWNARVSSLLFLYIVIKWLEL